MNDREKIFHLARQAALFIQKHHPQAKEWDNIIEWCVWYISNSFMGALRNEEGKICALIAARPVNDPDDGNIPYKHASDGQCIYIDFLAIEDREPRVYAAFERICRDRFGKREKIAYTRVAVHDYENLLRIARKQPKIGVLQHEPAETPSST